MRLLANPVMLRAIIVLVFAGSAFLMGLIFMRALRKNIAEERSFSAKPTTSLETLPMNLYNTVIQQLKQQKHELQVLSQTEQHRARTSETFSQAVLSNLSSGVLVFAGNGLVKTANPSAKSILGFASVIGMSAEDIFARAASGAAPTSPDEVRSANVADEVHAVLREGSKRRQVEAAYETPSGEKRFLSMTA